MSGSSTEPALVSTDAGRAYVKCRNNPEGPHSLVCDLVGTRLAAWLGLSTFEFAVLSWPSELVSVFRSGVARAGGPALAFREISQGHVWGGSADELVDVSNPGDFAGLVVLDTWLRNNDRYCSAPPNTKRNCRNVFFEFSARKKRLFAIDHTQVIRCDASELSRKIGSIARVKDEQIYGLFPEFEGLVTSRTLGSFLTRLGEFRSEDAASVTEGIPSEWEWSESLRDVVGQFLVDRGRFLSQDKSPLWGLRSSP